MSKWPMVALGEVCEIYQPQTISGKDLVDGGEYPVFGANGIIGYYDRFNHEKPQLLITCRGATCGTVNKSLPNSWITGNAMVVRPKQDNLSLEFLEHYFGQDGILSGVITGAAQPQITRKSFAPHEIPLPPLDEQKRIAAILDKADSLRRQRRQALALLDTLTQSIFVEMFGDPMTNPKGLDRKPLGEIIKVSSGDGLTAKDMRGGEYPVYGGNGVNGWHDEGKYPADTIIIGRVGVYCGAVHVTTRDAWVTDNALAVSKKMDIDTLYLADALKLADLNQYAGRAAQPLVSGSRIYPVEILVPSMKSQKEYEQAKSELKRQAGVMETNAVSLNSLFASLQSCAFSGEL